MTLGDFGIVTLMGLLWTAFGMWTGAWLFVPLAASYTGMMIALTTERIARIRRELIPEEERKE